MIRGRIHEVVGLHRITVATSATSPHNRMPERLGRINMNTENMTTRIVEGMGRSRALRNRSRKGMGGQGCRVNTLYRTILHILASDYDV